MHVTILLIKKTLHVTILLIKRPVYVSILLIKTTEYVFTYAIIHQRRERRAGEKEKQRPMPRDTRIAGPRYVL